MEDNFSSLVLHFDEQVVVSELFSCCTSSSDNDQVGIILQQEPSFERLSPPQNPPQAAVDAETDPRRTLQFYQQQNSLVSSSSSSTSANSSSSIILYQDDEIITSNNNSSTNTTNIMMDDPLNAAGINNNNNNDEEDLDALLAQADSMISAASSSGGGADGIVIDGFAIDSDEDDDAADSRERARTASTGEDGDIVDVSMDSPQTERPLQNAPSSGNAPKVPIQPSEDPLLHPLQEDVVHQNTHTNNNNMAYASHSHSMPPPNYHNGIGGAPTQPTFHTTGGPVGTAAAAVSHFPASVTSAMRNLGVGAVVTDPLAPSLESQFKAQTSRFAANLSSMAQRVASAASNVTPTHANQMNDSFEGNFPPPMSVPAMMQQQQSQLQPPQYLSTSSHSASTGSLHNSNNSPYASQSNSAHGMSSSSPTIPTTTPVAPMLHFELDTEQKQALVELQVGKLLPGEKVIMFLHNLLHVSDSTGFQYVANMSSSAPTTTTTSTGGGTPVWCCAMTYYRLIVFGTTQEMIVHIMNTVHVNNPSNPTTATTTTTTADDSPPLLQHASGVPSQWNTSCWPPAFPTVLEMPLSCLEKVEKTVYTASTHGSSPISPTTPSHQGRTTTLMGLQVWAKHGRYWRVTTPSYADTLRAHQALLTYAFPGRRNLGYLFAFESKRADVVNSVVTDPTTGQKTVSLALVRKRFDAVVEFQRQFNRYNVNSNNSNSSNDQSSSTPSSPTNNATMDPNTTSQPAMKPPPVQPWKIWTQLNAQYQLCMSYPSVLVGPASLDENNPDAVRLLQSCAAFRSEQRLPALAWASGMDGASIWRCSQPKIGLQGNRSSADELVIKHIMEAAKSANALRDQPLPVRMDANTMAAFTGANDLANSHWVKDAHCALKILDLRPRSAAMANRTGGYGYENTSNYPGTTLQFCNIGNIHAVRDAYQKMTALCLNMTNSTDVNWGSALEDTKWLNHIRIILAAAWETAFWVYVHRMPVLLHCSHGWDRTSQVSALAQLMLDPYYRTMEGFACLMEKDFMSFGHPFHTRCAHGEGKGGSGGGGVHHQDGVGGAGGIVGSSSDVNSSADEGQISPIFLQFLDCVWQMVHQYPECFEFTTDYLLELSEHIYSCRFGNMLCDTERERELVAGIRQRTYSVWDHLEQNSDDPNSDTKAKLWRNKQFDPSPNAGGGVLLMPMPTLLRNVTLWREKHAQFGPKATLRWRNSDQAHLWLPRPTETPVSS